MLEDQAVTIDELNSQGVFTEELKIKEVSIDELEGQYFSREKLKSLQVSIKELKEIPQKS